MLVPLTDETNHARKMLLRYDDGSMAVILFDQGFGKRQAINGDRHDFRATPARQVKTLFNSSAFVASTGESYIAVTRA